MLINTNIYHHLIGHSFKMKLSLCVFIFIENRNAYVHVDEDT